MSFLNDQEAFLYLKNTIDEPNALDERTNSDDYTTLAYTDAFKTISYKASKHSAVKKILAGELNEEGKTLYEVYSDPEDILKNVHNAVDGFVREAPQFDDLTMLAFRYLGSVEKE